MKKAVLYARVSSQRQQEEHTIESQLAELKRQIVESGNVLVKEYIDDGYSGARLDRPALDEMRNDLRTNQFDVIYFLCADRIARDVWYQNIVIDDIIKNKKRIIINGEDYENNPENYFKLTVLGAVSQLERAKIIERTTRGRRHRLRMGQVVSQGCNTYGYQYMKKGAKTAPALLINEVEAKVVRKIFELYATGKYGIGKICHWLEEHEIPTKTGNKFWRGCVVRLMLKNETYAGTRYYNKMFHLKESSDKKKTLKRGRVIVKARSEWIGIKVPTIVTKELFDQVQKVVQEKAKRYSQPMKSQLLSGLLYCGECGHAMSPYRRRVGAWLKIGIRRIYHKTAYLCTWRTLAKAHSKKAANPCNSPEIISSILEGKVFQMINDIMIDGVKLKTHMDFFKKDYRADQKKVEWKLTRLNKREKEIEKEKKRTMDAYVAGQITQQEYVDRNVKLDQELLKMKNKRNELFLTIPLLHKKEVVDMSMRQFCENAKMRLEKCHDYESRQKFLHDHIEKVIFQKDKVTLIGSVPIKTSDNEGGRIPFKIKDDFDKRKFHKKKRAKYLVDSRLKEWGSGGRNEKLFSTKSQELRSLASLASQITQQVL